MTLAARIVAEAAAGDVAAAGCRVAVAQLRDDLDNPDLTAKERRHRFDQVAAATKNLLARTPKENPTMAYVEYDILDSAANLIAGAISNGLPTADEAEWKGFDKLSTHLLEEVLQELRHDDLIAALRQAAARVEEPDASEFLDEDDDADEDEEADL